MEPQKNKKEITDDKTSIALMSQDISYIKKDLTKMGAKLDATEIKLDAVLNHYIHRAEFEAKIKDHQDQLDKRIEGVHERLGTKLDKEEFAPFKNAVWKVGTTFVIAALGGGFIASKIVDKLL